MSNGREAPGWAAHRMSRGEILATHAFLRDIPQRPSVPQRNGIAEVALGQTEAVLTQRKGVEPARYTLGRKVLLLLLYTLFIVEIKTGKMPNNIGPTVNNMLKDIVEKKKKKKSRYKRKREGKKWRKVGCNEQISIQ